MLEFARPFPRIHEGRRLCLTRRKVGRQEIGERSPRKFEFSRFVAFGSNPIQIQAKGILRWVAADGAVPSTVVLCDANAQVMHEIRPPTSDPVREL
jgi:hypothetical protein